MGLGIFLINSIIKQLGKYERSIFFKYFYFFSFVLANAQINSNSQWARVAGDSTVDQGGVYGIQGVASPNNKPGERSLPACWTDIDGNFWLFGGGPNGGGRLNDLWKYNPVTNIWIWMNGNNQPNQPGVYVTVGISAPTNPPGARAGSAAWSDTNGNHITQTSYPNRHHRKKAGAY